MTAPAPTVDVLDQLDYEPPCDLTNWTARKPCDQPARWIVRITNHPSAIPNALACDDHGASARRLNGRTTQCCGTALNVTVEALT